MTALEGERLQGFPDGWTDVQHEGAEPTFYQRWQAIGNSMAVPVIRYLGQRIQTLEESGHATRP
jgi:DNA (cytosine-5)-methyltransferase 1